MSVFTDENMLILITVYTNTVVIVQEIVVLSVICYIRLLLSISLDRSTFVNAESPTKSRVSTGNKTHPSCTQLAP